MLLKHPIKNVLKQKKTTKKNPERKGFNWIPFSFSLRLIFKCA